MTIEFLLDDISDKDRKEIKDIIKTLRKTRSKPVLKEALFLRKFTLSLMKSYNKPKPQEFPKLKVSISQVLQHQYEAPQPIDLLLADIPEPISLDIVPEPLMIEEEIPVPVRLKDRVHEPISTNELHAPINTKALTAFNEKLEVPKKMELRPPTPN